jgi:hypothetical protein
VKSVITHGVLAVGGLILAWIAWTEEVTEDVSPDAVELLDCSDGIESIALLSERRDTTVEARGEDEDQRYYWITIERRSSNGESSTKEFVGGDAVDELVEKLSPFRAERSLGRVDEDLLPELDLAPSPPEEPEEGEEPREPPEWSPTRLRLRCGGDERTFVVGGSTFGLPRRYLMNDDDEESPVYLVDAAVVSDVEAAEHRLMQRELHRFEMSEVETLHVSAFDRERTLKHRHRSDPRRAEWVDAEEPDRRNELFGNWLDIFRRLTVQEFLAVDAEPGADLEPVPASHEVVLELEYKDEGGEVLDTLELARVSSEPAEYYARSRATRAWVKVIRTVAQQIEDDARPVLGLEPIEREEPVESTPEDAAPPDGTETEGAEAPTPPAGPATPPAPPPVPGHSPPPGGGE